MPNFAGRPLAEAEASLEKAGFVLGKVRQLSADDPSDAPRTAGTILRQSPPAGQKIATGETISFDVVK